MGKNKGLGQNDTPKNQFLNYRELTVLAIHGALKKNKEVESFKNSIYFKKGMFGLSTNLFED